MKERFALERDPGNISTLYSIAVTIPKRNERVSQEVLRIYHDSMEPIGGELVPG